MYDDNWLTYQEAAERLGLSVEGVRARARREMWRRQVGNDGKARVVIPPDTTPSIPEEPTGNRENKRPATARNDLTALQDRITALEADLKRAREDADRERLERIQERDRADKLTNELSSLATRLADAERQKGDAEKQAALSTAEVGHLQARIEAEMKAHRDELERHRKMASSELDRVRMEGEREAAEMQSIIDEWRARPWWRRLIG